MHISRRRSFSIVTICIQVHDVEKCQWGESRRWQFTGSIRESCQTNSSVVWTHLKPGGKAIMICAWHPLYCSLFINALADRSIRTVNDASCRQDFLFPSFFFLFLFYSKLDPLCHSFVSLSLSLFFFALFNSFQSYFTISQWFPKFVFFFFLWAAFPKWKFARASPNSLW